MFYLFCSRNLPLLALFKMKKKIFDIALEGRCDWVLFRGSCAAIYEHKDGGRHIFALWHRSKETGLLLY